MSWFQSEINDRYVLFTLVSEEAQNWGVQDLNLTLYMTAVQVKWFIYQTDMLCI